MTIEDSKANATNDTHQSAADTHEHQYDEQNSHDHDSHLKQSTSPQDTKGYQRTLLFSFIIITGYMFVEAIGGWLTGSLALLSDAQ